MKNIKAVTFFDLDGTLLNEKSDVSPDVADAMTALKNNDILPVIATGRTEVEIDGIMKKTGIGSCIVMNGQFIRVLGKTVYENIIAPELCDHFYNFAKSLDQEVSFYSSRRIWARGTNQSMKEAYSYFHATTPEILSEDPSDPVNMLLVLGQEHDEKYFEEFPEFTFYRNSPFSIDTVMKGVSKGSGVKNLLGNLKLSHVPTFGFGDGPNDIALLETCDTAIAMGNARDEVKEISDYVTAKNSEGGIVQALKYFDLI